MNPRMSEAVNPERGGGLAAPVSASGMPPLVRRVALGLAVVWLALVAGVGWWASQQWVAEWMDRLAASAQQEAQATARVMDRLFTEMASVANKLSKGRIEIQLFPDSQLANDAVEKVYS